MPSMPCLLRRPHPSYSEPIPAYEQIRTSITSHRGCFGGCAFCAITHHQGRTIQSRSADPSCAKSELSPRLPWFRGHIRDMGGPTANMFGLRPAATRAERMPAGKLPLPRALHKPRTGDTPATIPSCEAAPVPGCKKSRFHPGVRYDCCDGRRQFPGTVPHHVSGQLKVAPEHIAPKVTRLMGKPGKEVYLRFAAAFNRMNEELGKEQYLVPYLMSSHPGRACREAVELAEFLRDMNYHPEQVQDFIPTPGSLSTCMYYTGLHPLTGEKVYVAKDPHEKRLQRALLQYRDPRTTTGAGSPHQSQPSGPHRPRRQVPHPSAASAGGRRQGRPGGKKKPCHPAAEGGRTQAKRKARAR